MIGAIELAIIIVTPLIIKAIINKINNGKKSRR